MNHYLINSPNVIADDFEEETVIVNLVSGNYFSIQGITAKIFKHLSSGVTLDQIVLIFNEQEAISKEDMLKDLTFFAKKLVELDILKESDVGPRAMENPQPINYERPTISIYDDLDDIIKVDPIHEVSPELGWPGK